MGVHKKVDHWATAKFNSTSWGRWFNGAWNSGRKMVKDFYNKGWWSPENRRTSESKTTKELFREHHDSIAKTLQKLVVLDGKKLGALEALVKEETNTFMEYPLHV